MSDHGFVAFKHLSSPWLTTPPRRLPHTNTHTLTHARTHAHTPGLTTTTFPPAYLPASGDPLLACLPQVTPSEWEAIPDIGDYTIKRKPIQSFVPVPDSLLSRAGGAQTQQDWGAVVMPRVSHGSRRQRFRGACSCPGLAMTLVGTRP